MAFGIDDLAIATTAETVKDVSCETVKECASETIKDTEKFIADKSFEAKNFNFESANKEVSDFDSKECPSAGDVTDTEFSPEKFNDYELDNSDVSKVNDNSAENIERTSTFEDQTIDNFELEEIRSEIESDLKLGYEHDGSILRENMETAMGKQSDAEVSNAHHIVGNDTPNAAKKLEEYGIDRNDPANGIFLPNSTESPLKGAVHGQGRHIADYSNEVEQRASGVTSREEMLEVLQSIKEDLYNGELAVHYDIPANK
jgi:hypothetical protein